MILPTQSLLIRKTTWLVRQQYPFITSDDVMEFYNDLVQAEEPDTTPISQISATDLADFICDVVSDV